MQCHLSVEARLGWWNIHERINAKRIMKWRNYFGGEAANRGQALADQCMFQGRNFLTHVTCLQATVEDNTFLWSHSTNKFLSLLRPNKSIDKPEKRMAMGSPTPTVRALSSRQDFEFYPLQKRS